MYLINLSDLSIYLAIYPPIYLAIYVSLCVHTDRHIYTHLRAFKSRVHRFCIDMRILIVCEYLAVSFVLFGVSAALFCFRLLCLGLKSRCRCSWFRECSIPQTATLSQEVPKEKKIAAAWVPLAGKNSSLANLDLVHFLTTDPKFQPSVYEVSSHEVA